MDMERVNMTNPLIQIDDEIREMTDEEYADYLLEIQDSTPITP